MFRYREAIGLDISDGMANIVFARRWGFMARVCAAQTIRLSDNPEEAAQVLQGFFEKQGWLDIPCVIGLRGESLMLRVVDCEATDSRSVEAVVDEQMDHFSSLSSSATVSEHVLTRAARGNAQIVLGVARMDTVLKRIDRVRQIGLNIVDLIPGPIALHNAVSYLMPWYSSPAVCVDVGEESTQVVIGQGRAITFARRFLMGSRLLSGEEGDEGGQRELFEPGSGEEGEKKPGHEESFKEWLAELKGCLAFYRSRFPDERMHPGRIVVCGRYKFGPERLEGIAEATSIEAITVSELGRAKHYDGEQSLVAATGFAMAGLGREKVRLSLLPDHMKEVTALRWQFKYWLAAGLALLLASLLIVLRLRSDLVEAGDMIEEKRQRVQRLQRLEQRLYRLESENKSLERQITPLRVAIDNGRIFRAVLRDVARAKHRDDWLTLIADSSSYFNEGLNGNAAGAPAYLEEEAKGEYPIRSFDKIVLEGYTPLNDLSTVRAMIETLRESEVVADVDLLPDDKVRSTQEEDSRWEGVKRSRFAVEISVVEP